MELTKKEKDYLRLLVKKEYDHVSNEEKTMLDFSPDELALEEGYDVFLQALLKKLK